MDKPIYALVTGSSVLSERPGERGWTVEGAVTDGAECVPFEIGEPLFRLVEEALLGGNSAKLLLSVGRERADFALLPPLDKDGEFVLADGEGRFFDFESRRPVNRAGRHISFAQQLHEARNHASHMAARARAA